MRQDITAGGGGGPMPQNHQMGPPQGWNQGAPPGQHGQGGPPAQHGGPPVQYK